MRSNGAIKEARSPSGFSTFLKKVMALAALSDSVVCRMETKWSRIVINAVKKGVKNGTLVFFVGANFLDFIAI